MVRLSIYVVLVAIAAMNAARCINAAEPTAETSVDTVSGRVFLDANGNGQFDPGEQPLEGIRITDSVRFTTTGNDGSYSMKISDDPEIPYKPGRVVSVSWPSAKWPSGRWWRRLSEIKPNEHVNFGLKEQKQDLPFLFIHSSDDHGCGGVYPRLSETLKQQCGDMARFAINTGDLGYAGPEIMDDMFGRIQSRAKDFFVPMIFTPGNHDMTGRTAAAWAQPRYGTWGFTKYLGPIRWSFTYGGTHFTGLDWADIGHGNVEGVCDVAADWLEQDIKSLGPGTRKLVFVHFPTGCKRYYDVIAKYHVDHIFAGHNHQDREYDFAGIPASTVLNTAGPTALLGVVQDNSFDIIHFCGGCKAWNYHSKHCALSKLKSLSDGAATRHGSHHNASEKTLSRETQTLAVDRGPVEIAAQISPKDSKRCGLRIGDKATIDVVYDGKVIWVAGTPVPFAFREQDKSLDWHMTIENDQLTIFGNSLFRLIKAVKIDNPSKVTMLAEDGAATFHNVDVWSLKAVPPPKLQTNTVQ